MSKYRFPIELLIRFFISFWCLIAIGCFVFMDADAAMFWTWDASTRALVLMLAVIVTMFSLLLNAEGTGTTTYIVDSIWPESDE